ncbi:transposase [Roseimaritima ulvae]|uniref:transposase n=1 Tax=Roseimaritima ulvae TaxID=980254 RepID=UPI001FD593D3|nr:transposase [Roseimaritima ulvae]
MIDLTEDERAQRELARAALLYPPVRLTGLQALSIAKGFATAAAKNGYSIWACSIMPEHVHLVIGRHTYKVEQLANLLKGAATRQLNEDHRHPLAECAKPGQRPPCMWASRQWKVYLDREEAIENAIAYVLDNPIKEGKQPQRWSWITPYTGLDAGWTTYH